MQGKFAPIVDDGVSGIAAALIAYHHLIRARDKVNHTSLALITPVNACNGTV